MNDTKTDLRLHDLWPPEGIGVREDAEREILRRAIHLFGRRGYGGTSMRTIAAEASVTAPLIGYHFGSKEGLFEACAHMVLASTTEELLRVDRAEGLLGSVREFAAKHFEFARRYPDALRFILTVAYGPEESQPRVDLVRYWLPITLEIVRWFDRAIAGGELQARSGATAPGLARHLLNTVHMEVLTSYEKERFGIDESPCHTGEDLGDDARLDDLVDQFFRGAGALRPTPSGENRS